MNMRKQLVVVLDVSGLCDDDIESVVTTDYRRLVGVNSIDY